MGAIGREVKKVKVIPDWTPVPAGEKRREKKQREPKPIHSPRPVPSPTPA